MKRNLSTFASLLALGVASPVTAQVNNPNVIPVNCGTGGVIQTAIDGATIAQPVEIVVTGTCTENISVRRDQVTVRGDTPGSKSGTIVGSFDIRGSDLVRLQDLIVRDSAGITPGVHVGFGASARLENVLVNRHKGPALRVFRNAAVYANKSRFIALPASENGVQVIEGGSLRLERSQIFASRNESGQGAALGVFRGGIVRMQYNVQITHTNPSPIDEYQGSAIMALDGSIVRTQNQGVANAINGNIVVSELSSADLRNVTINVNSFAHRMGLIEFRNTTTVNGNVRVGTRALVDFRGVAPSGSVDCFQEGAVRAVGGGVTPGANCTVF